MTQNMPAGEVGIDLELVRILLADQFPELADRPLSVLANGWDNTLFRLGDDLVVRLPRRQVAAALIGHEQRWLPHLTPGLSVPIPVPLHAGRPGPHFPWPWSITAYRPGRVAAEADDLDRPQLALALGTFLAELHRPAPPDAPINPVRGVPLERRSESFRANLAGSGGAIEVNAAEALWRDAVTAALWPGPPVWVHGDLHPANLLTRGGELAAVLDFGDVTAGDPATDLAVAWMIFPPAERAAFWERYAAAVGHRVDAALRLRARGWALALGATFVANSADSPVMAGIGATTIRAVLGVAD